MGWGSFSSAFFSMLDSNSLLFAPVSTHLAREALTLPVSDCLFKDVYIANCLGRQRASLLGQRSDGLTSLEDMESSSRAKGQCTY